MSVWETKLEHVQAGGNAAEISLKSVAAWNEEVQATGGITSNLLIIEMALQQTKSRQKQTFFGSLEFEFPDTLSCTSII